MSKFLLSIILIILSGILNLLYNIYFEWNTGISTGFNLSILVITIGFLILILYGVAYYSRN